MQKIDRKLFIQSAEELKSANLSGFTGIYAGSSFCQEKLPSSAALQELIDIAMERGLSFHFSTPYLTETYFARAVQLIEILAGRAPASEVIVNDLGLLSAFDFRAAGLIPVAGRILAYQKTDPQSMKIVEDSSSASEREKKLEVYRAVSVNKNQFAEFLKKYGVSRLEIQNPLHGVELKNKSFSYSLHVPYVYVSSTRFCPPTERYTKPGRVPGVYPCSRRCESDYFLLNPHGSGHRLILRGNTVFFENKNVIVPEGVDRIVTHTAPS